MRLKTFPPIHGSGVGACELRSLSAVHGGERACACPRVKGTKFPCGPVVRSGPTQRIFFLNLGDSGQAVGRVSFTDKG